MTGRRLLAGLGLAVFSIAFSALLGAQVALVSFLDPERADAAAREVATSDVAALLVERTVRSTVTPYLDPASVDAVVAATSTDPAVVAALQESLSGAYRYLTASPVGAIAGSDLPATSFTDNDAVGSVIADAIVRVGQQNGIDLGGALPAMPGPSVVPSSLPQLDLRTLAERIRLIAGAVAVLAAALALAVHPRRGRALSTMGMRAGVTTLVWLAGMFVGGWLLGNVGGSLLGDTLQRMWSASMGGVTAVLVAVLVLSAGVWLAGRALDGFTRARATG